jgi:hypothetical protein
MPWKATSTWSGATDVDGLRRCGIRKKTDLTRAASGAVLFASLAMVLVGKNAANKSMATDQQLTATPLTVGIEGRV